MEVTERRSSRALLGFVRRSCAASARCPRSLAQEGITVGRRRGARLFEFSALLIRIRALRETRGFQATKEIGAALAGADAWLEMSGAKSYKPFLHVERAEVAQLNGDDTARRRELHEAHRLFLEIGAPIRAEQVAKELGG